MILTSPTNRILLFLPMNNFHLIFNHSTQKIKPDILHPNTSFVSLQP